jgi:hypothetical protein
MPSTIRSTTPSGNFSVEARPAVQVHPLMVLPPRPERSANKPSNCSVPPLTLSSHGRRFGISIWLFNFRKININGDMAFAEMEFITTSWPRSSFAALGLRSGPRQQISVADKSSICSSKFEITSLLIQLRKALMWDQSTQ